MNAAKTTGSVALSIGKNSKANMGSVAVEDSTVKNSTVVNASQNTGSAALAIAKESHANVGSVDIH